MEGLIYLLIVVGWIISAVNKKKKKAAKKKPSSFSGAQTVNAAANREQRIAQMRAELERRKMERQRNAEEQLTFIPEGASYGETGSMKYDSSEGECICDPELEHERETVSTEETVYTNEIGSKPLVDFSARGIMQGVVMNEILTRPAQRAKRLH